IEDVLGGEQTTVRVRRIGRPEDLVAERERRRVTAGQVGADRRSWRPGAEDGAVADVTEGRIAVAVSVVGLRQSPDVVVSHRLRVSLADSDLVVQRLGRVVSHAEQPVGSEPRLYGEVRRGRAGSHLGREVAYAGEEDRGRVA